MRCIQCDKRSRARDSLFCSKACKDDFARTMPEAIECGSCSAQADGIQDAIAGGWSNIEADPEGFSWNYLGTCPDCREEQER